MPYVGANTNYTINGTDIGTDLVTREYLIDVYPSLIDTFRFAGLWLWGENDFGQLGTGTSGITHRRSSPVQTLSGGTNWKQVSFGRRHVASIKTDGTLWLWGSNGQGQIGNQQDGSISPSTPVQTISAGTNWKQVSCGGLYTAAIKTDNSLWAWGYNEYGQLGINSTDLSRNSPVLISGSWAQIDAGSDNTVALKTDGTLWTWGRNSSGQLGDNTTTTRSSPVQTISGGTNWKQVSAGSSHTSAIKTDGTLWLWGVNDSGQLGDNTRTNRSSPVQTVTGGTNWKQVSAGQGMTAAITTNGTLLTWGANGNGQLGDNTVANKSSPVQTVSGGTNWKQVSTTSTHIAAIKTDGTLWTWGKNNYGQLGDNSIASKSSPVQTVSGGTNWKQVAGGYSNIACIRDDSSDPFRADPI